MSATLLAAGSLVSTALAGPAPAQAATPAGGSLHALAPARVATVPLAAHQTRAVTVGGHGGVPSAGVLAVAGTLSAESPSHAGTLVAWRYGASRPATTAVTFVAHQSNTDGVLVPLSASGRLDVYNSSAGPVTLTLDVTGYVPAASSAGSGALQPVTPARVADTTRGTDGNRKGALAGGRTYSFTLGGHGGVPTSGVAAVALTLTALAPTRTGALTAYAPGAARPADATVHVKAGQAVSAFAVVPVSSGRIDVYDATAGGSVQVRIDVSGYLTTGIPTVAGHAGVVALARAARVSIGAHGTATVTVGGRPGVPRRGVSAAVVAFTASGARSTGGAVAWAAGAHRPAVSTLRWVSGQTVTTAVVVPLSAAGQLEVYNAGSTAVSTIVDVVGYVRSTTVAVPAASVGRYVRNISTADSDPATMQAEGVADAEAGSRLTVLDIGAQANDRSGVVLSGTDTTVPYGNLVQDIEAYITGADSVAGAPSMRILVATNNDGNFSEYPADQRAGDWIRQVISPLANFVYYMSPHILVEAAADIEPDGSSTEAQAQLWVTSAIAWLKEAEDSIHPIDANHPEWQLYFIGSADGCPATYGSTAACAYGWTQQQLYSLAYSTDPTRQRVLPQVYTGAQAVQWANIAATGGSAAGLVGALTEHAACPTVQAGCPIASYPPTQGWVALHTALSVRFTSPPSLPYVSDLRIS